MTEEEITGRWGTVSYVISFLCLLSFLPAFLYFFFLSTSFLPSFLYFLASSLPSLIILPSTFLPSFRYMVAIVMQRQAGSKRIPEWEEAAATACAVSAHPSSIISPPS